MGFFEALGIDTEPSDMSFSLSIDSGSLEWASHSLSTVFCQRKNIVSPSFLIMIRDVLRFGREAPLILEARATKMYDKMSLGEYLSQNKYSESFINNYILPMCAAVWSVPALEVLRFPVVMLVRFWANHHLLDIFQRPRWRVVVGRSRSYVDRVISELPDVRTSTEVLKVFCASGDLGESSQPGVIVKASDGDTHFDDVVLATHSDISLKLLGGSKSANSYETTLNACLEMSVQESSADLSAIFEVLEAIQYNSNDVWLHTDASLMPKNRSAWASWNCIGTSSADAAKQPVCVSYWVNRLQSLPSEAPDIFVTLNPVHPPAAEKVIRRVSLAHPVFNEASVSAQARLPRIQGTHGIYLAGAWTRYGFHEDGIRSAIDVVERMGGVIPWTPISCSPKLSLLDRSAIYLFDRFAKQTIRTGRIRFILPNGEELQYGTPQPPVGGHKEAWRGRPPLNATVRIYDASFFRKVISRHDTGLGESYMDGDYEVIEGSNDMGGDLGSLLAVATANAVNIQDQRGLLGIFNRLGDRALHLAHLSRSNNAFNARRNIEEHYDAGNAMYELFLDESMTYSCGVWSHADGTVRAKTLYESQINKIDALIEKANIQKDHHVLEIGCGWGSFAIRAASLHGCRVTGLTLSKEQLAEAQARVKAAGLEDKITLLLCDYRDCPNLGTYDRVVSCEMIEAVGHEHLPAYFATIGAALKPGGRAVLQVIAEPDERYESYCNSSDFIREHVFPGGHLPCIGACVEAARGTGLSVHGCEDVGPDYAVTLRAWRKAWEEKKDKVLELGYPLRFWKKYRFYFAYCEAGFDAHYIHTFQLTWVKDGEFELSSDDLRYALEMSKRGKLRKGQLQFSSKRKGVPEEERRETANGRINMDASMGVSAWSGNNGLASSDVVTQILMCLYFFLAGAAISTSPTLWLLPMSTLASFVVFAGSAIVSDWIVPGRSALPPEQMAEWNFDTVQIVFVSISSLWTFVHFSNHSVAEVKEFMLSTYPLERTPRALTAASGGVFAFVLWALVQARWHRGSHARLMQYAVLLTVFAVAAHKNMYTYLLTAALAPQASTAVSLMLKRGADLKIWDADSRLQKCMDLLNITLFIVMKLLGYIMLLFFVAVNYSAFESKAVWWLSLCGLLYVSIQNLLQMGDILHNSRIFGESKCHCE